MNKKLILTLTAALMLGALTACGTDTESSTAAPPPTNSTADQTGSTADDPAKDESSASEGGDSSEESSVPNSEYTGGGIDFDFNFNGTVITVGEEAAPILEALGTEDSVFEAPSCAFTGVSYYYTYGGVQVVTYPDEFDQALNRIYEVDLLDDSVATNEGISVGMTYDELVAMYGTPDAETAAYAMYKTDGKAVQFFLTGNEIESIIYTVQLS